MSGNRTITWKIELKALNVATQYSLSRSEYKAESGNFETDPPTIITPNSSGQCKARGTNRTATGTSGFFNYTAGNRPDNPTVFKFTFNVPFSKKQSKHTVTVENNIDDYSFEDFHSEDEGVSWEPGLPKGNHHQWAKTVITQLKPAKINP